MADADGMDGPRRSAVVVMGVSASGKTSTGEALAAILGVDFIDSDALHPIANVAKMTSGQPLTDEDRWPWLDRVGATLGDTLGHPRGVVVACSALRRIYRDRIRAAVPAGLVFVFLDIDRAEARRRIAGRRGHFMPPALIDSQFDTLERPDREPDIVTIGHLVTPVQSAQDAADALRVRDALRA